MPLKVTQILLINTFFLKGLSPGFISTFLVFLVGFLTKSEEQLMAFYDIPRVEIEGISGEHSGFNCSSGLHKMHWKHTLLQTKYFCTPNYSKTKSLAVQESKTFILYAWK